jgi:hypothetical protein
MDPIHDQQLEEAISPIRLRSQNLLKDTILCSICKNLLSFVESKICSNCGEQICKRCIPYNCPGKECDPSYHNGVLPRFVREQLEILEVKCKFNGCPFYIQLKHLDDHQSMCNFRRQKCDFCNLIYDSESIEQHKKNCTQRLQKCENCSFEGKLNEFQHDCKMIQRFDQIDKKLEHFDHYIKKFEELEKLILKSNNLLKIPSRSKLGDRLNKTRLKKRNPANFNQESTNNLNNIGGTSQNYVDIQDSNLVEYERIPHIYSSSGFTAVSELKINNYLLIGNSEGEIRSSSFYKFHSFFSPKHEGSVTYILDLETSDFKFITAGEDKKLIIRKFYDKTYFEQIEQGTHSTYLEKTNQEDKIISVDEDDKLRIWDIRNKVLLKTIQNRSRLSIDRFKKDESLNYFLLSQNNKSIDLYDMDNLTTKIKFENEFKICFIMYYQGDCFLTLDEKNNICLWDIRNTTALAKYKFKGKGDINSMFIVKSKTLAFITNHRDIYFLDLSDNNLTVICRKNLLNHKGECMDNEIYYGQFNKILAIFKMNSHYLHLFRFIDD